MNRPNNIVDHGRTEPKGPLGDLDLSRPVELVVLSVNPNDNQGVRLLIDDVRAQEPWTDDAEKQ